MKKLALLFLLLPAALFCGDEFSASKSSAALLQDGFTGDKYTSLRLETKIGKVNIAEENTASVSGTGFALFSRNYLLDISASAVPSAAEFGVKVIKIAVSPGEYEPFVAGIYPFEALKNCRITCGDFRSIEGALLPAGTFEINNVLMRPVGTTFVTVKGEILERADNIPSLAPLIPKAVWINAHPPANTPAGLYSGKLIVSPEGQPPAEIKVEAEVLPFKLKNPPPERMNWLGIMSGSWDFERQAEEFRCIREHNYTGEITNALAPEGDDFTKANRYMELAKQAGMPGIFIHTNTHCQGGLNLEGSYGPNGHGLNMFNSVSYAKTAALVAKVKANADKNKWLKTVYYLSTELGTTFGEGGTADFTFLMNSIEEYYSGIKAAGVETLATFNRREEFALHAGLPTIDWTGFNGEMFPEWEKSLKEKPSLMTFIGIDQRMGHGFYMWKFGFRGVRPWCLDPGVMYPREQGLVYYYDKKAHPSVRFERIREGADDYRYIYTLSEVMKEAEAKGIDTKEASNMINLIMGYIPYNHKKDTPGVDYLKQDEYRGKIAEETIKLLAKLGK